MIRQTRKLGGIYGSLFKRKLRVPYITQINENACGAAILEMVYEYHGMENISQEDIFNKYKELEPHGSGNIRLNTDSIVADAMGLLLSTLESAANKEKIMEYALPSIFSESAFKSEKRTQLLDNNVIIEMLRLARSGAKE